MCTLLTYDTSENDLKGAVAVAMTRGKTWLEAGPESWLLCQHKTPQCVLRNV